MAENGTFYWNELMTNDLDRAKAFYGAALGWTFEAMPMPEGSTYWVAKQGDRPVGGLMDMTGMSPPGGPPALVRLHRGGRRKRDGGQRRVARRDPAAPLLRRAGCGPHCDPDGPDGRGTGLDDP